MRLAEADATAETDTSAADDEPARAESRFGSEGKSTFGRVAARCWALLLARIFECLPLACPECGEPMRIIAFVLDRPAIERILAHIGEPTAAPEVLPARTPPQAALEFDQSAGAADWPDMDQTAGAGGDAGA